MGTIDLTQDWTRWRVSDERVILKPATDYEGFNLPIMPSATGASTTPEHALRDPAIYEESGRTWLLYSLAGEQGIALAELLFLRPLPPATEERCRHVVQLVMTYNVVEEAL